MHVRAWTIPALMLLVILGVSAGVRAQTPTLAGTVVDISGAAVGSA